MSDLLHPTTHLTAPDLRAEVARVRARAFRVAARLDMHPSTLSLILNGHRAFDQALAERVVAALKLEQRHSGTQSRVGCGFETDSSPSPITF